MNLRNRLTKLEGRVGAPGRCSVCRSWGSRIVRTDWRTDRPLEPAVPERCPNCGYRPVTIEVVRIEDWRAERGHRPE